MPSTAVIAEKGNWISGLITRLMTDREFVTRKRARALGDSGGSSFFLASRFWGSSAGVVTALERSEPPGFGARVRALLLVSMPPLNIISSRDPGKPVYRSDVAQARQRERSKLWARRDAQSTRGRARRMRHSAANRAKKKRVPFSISVDDVLAQIPSDMRCPVLGLLFATDGSGAAMTIDCVIPKLGYQPGNFRVISKRANSLKYVETTPWRLLNALTHRGTREDQILVANYITREVPKVHALFAHAS